VRECLEQFRKETHADHIPCKRVKLQSSPLSPHRPPFVVCNVLVWAL
jgi:hypothetical protein